jgi:hypothetical protein
MRFTLGLSLVDDFDATHELRYRSFKLGGRIHANHNRAGTTPENETGRLDALLLSRMEPHCQEAGRLTERNLQSTPDTS